MWFSILGLKKPSWWYSLPKKSYAAGKMHKGVSKNIGIPKSSILIGFSIIYKPSILGYGTPTFGNTHKDPIFFGIYQEQQEVTDGCKSPDARLAIAFQQTHLVK